MYTQHDACIDGVMNRNQFRSLQSAVYEENVKSAELSIKMDKYITAV